MNRLSEKILNSDSIVFTRMIDGEMHSKTANKLNIGEYVLTFLIESLSPSLTGYFKYCKVIDKKNRFYKKSDVSLFHKKDGIKISLPENYNFPYVKRQKL